MSQNQHQPGVFAPPYYRSFHCLADRCRHSCCIDWEICIDDATLSKYQPFERILRTVTVCEDGACFTLTEDGRCPHLNERGLCEIILSHGENYLSDICRLHPRFFNDVGGGRTEVGLGLVCEEACRLILESEQPFSLAETENPLGECAPSMDADEESGRFDPLPLRDGIIAAIEAPGGRYDDMAAALRASFELPTLRSPNEWMDRFLSLEILDEAWSRILHAARGVEESRVAGGSAPTDAYSRRLLTYFVYRHVSVASSRDNLRARLGFTLLSVDMLRALWARSPEPSSELLAELARRYSAEIEYSEDNTDELIFEFECQL